MLKQSINVNSIFIQTCVSAVMPWSATKLTNLRLLRFHGVTRMNILIFSPPT